MKSCRAEPEAHCTKPNVATATYTMSGSVTQFLLLFFSVFIYFAQPSNGRQHFSPFRITADADGVRSVYTADFEGDGLVDVLSACSGDNKIAWYRNEGGGTFSSQRIISSDAILPWSVHAGDLDGDGLADVLSASSGGGRVAWYRNEGGGAFSPQRVLFENFFQARSVYAADLDNDGLVDVLSAAGGSQIAWYRNEGGGTFTSVKTIAMDAQGAYSVYAADLDGDGFLDVMSASANDDTIAWYRNEGDGGFSEPRFLSRDAEGARCVYAADLDGDGLLDVLSASLNDDTIAWYRNNGNGTFSPKVVITTTANGAQSVFVADVDGDGAADVLSASSYDWTIAWYRNEGNGQFSARMAISNTARDAAAVYAADLDGDGLIDVLSAAPGHDTLMWYRNEGGSLFAGPATVTPKIEGARFVHAVDLDDDGNLDILSASSSDNKVVWFRNEGAGTFSNFRVITTAARHAESVYSADLDGDGLQDVLSASVRDNKIAWYRNEGDGLFSTQNVITAGALGAASVFAADLDSDGFIDVLSASAYDDKIAWYRNKGGGNFTSEIILSIAAEGAACVFAMDLDDDGMIDVLSASSDDNKIAWYRNEGGGNFSSEQIITTFADGAASVYAADLDGDGLPEVLSASSSDYTIAWYPNEGNGSFSAQRVITRQAAGARSVFAADLDGDGRADVLSASFDTNRIDWYRNEGGGLFLVQQAISVSVSGPVCVSAADINGDGRMDVLSTGFLTNTIAWHPNQGGSRPFTTWKLLNPLVDSPQAVFAADLDGDGLVDILSASMDDNKVAWYHNEGDGVFSSQRVINWDAVGAQSVFAADLDGDGLTDVLSAAWNYGEIAWYRNEGGGAFSMEQLISQNAGQATSVYATDLDNDGLVDVLSSAQVGGKIEWYRNEGSGAFSDAILITAEASGATSVHAADLDGDGLPDVLSASPNDHKIAWYHNRGQGSFSEQRIISLETANALSVFAADLDADGLIDVLSASPGDDKIAWYRNQGNGTFSTQQVISTNADRASCVYAADVDADGLQDVISTSFGDNKIAWYRNEGSGLFSHQRVITQDVKDPTSVYAADLNGDGLLDVVAALKGNDMVAVYFQHSPTLMSLGPDATPASCTESRHCLHPADLPSVALPSLVQLTGGITISIPWIFEAGGSLTIDGQGNRLSCTVDMAEEACIQIMARDTAFFRNVTFIISPGVSAFVETRSVRSVGFYGVNVWMQDHWAQPEGDNGPRLPWLRIMSQPPPRQSGSLVLVNVVVHEGVAGSSLVQAFSLFCVVIMKSSFLALTRSGLAQHGSEQPYVLQVRDVPHLVVQDSTMRNLNGISVLNATKVAQVSLFRAEVENCTGSAARDTFGMIYLDDVTTAKFMTVRFSNNSCVHCSGGALSIEFRTVVTTLLVSDVSFCYNSVWRGGAVAILDYTSSLNLWRPSLARLISGMDFLGNAATAEGGALYWRSALKYTQPTGINFQLQDQAATILLENCGFRENLAPLGAALAVEKSNMIASSTDFSDNEASVAGGGVWLTRSSAVFSNCTWAGNKVVPQDVNGLQPRPIGSTTSGMTGGAAVAAVDCFVAGATMLNSDFRNNSVTGPGFAGGAIHASRCSLHLRHVHFEANTATSYRGGGVACQNCELLHIEDTVAFGNTAAAAGGAVWIQEGTLEAVRWVCEENSVVGEESDVLGGGCLAAFKSTIHIEEGTRFGHNKVLAVSGVGGNLFLDCTTAATTTDSTPITNGIAAIGSNVFAECYDTPESGTLQIPSVVLLSPTIASATSHLHLIEGPNPLVNSIASDVPVAAFKLLDAFENERWDDNSTVCTVSAVGNETGLPAAVLSSIRFHAVTGKVVLYPFSVLASRADSAVILHVACVTQATVEMAADIIVTLEQPVLIWEVNETEGYPSERTSPLLLQQPALSIRILIGGVPTSSTQSFVCSVASAQPGLGTVIGDPYGVPNITLIAFPGVAVSAGLGSVLPIRASCQLPSGVLIVTQQLAAVRVASVGL